MTGKNGGTVFACGCERMRKCTALGCPEQCGDRVSLHWTGILGPKSSCRFCFNGPVHFHVTTCTGQALCGVEVPMKYFCMVASVLDIKKCGCKIVLPLRQIVTPTSLPIVRSVKQNEQAFGD